METPEGVAGDRILAKMLAGLQVQIYWLESDELK